MIFHRPVVSTLALFAAGALLAPAVSPAEAGGRVLLKAYVKGLGEKNDLVSVQPLVIVDNDPDNEVASVELRVSSDGGEEDLVLTESDAWLHGSTALSALPTKETTLVLHVHMGEGTMLSFSGTLATDGSVSLDAAETACDVYTKLGCSFVAKYDVEVLAAEIFPSGKGYALALDLAGADTYEVTSATVEVAGGDKAEVDWEAVGSVWQAEATLAHAGDIDVKAKVLDTAGNTVENIKTELAEPWADDGEGVNAMAAGSGTSVALTPFRFTTEGKPRWRHSWMTVASSGWTTTSYPTHAELEIAGGETVTVPANSYQRFRKRPEILYQAWDNEIQEYLSGLVIDTGSTISISSGSVVFEGYSAAELSAGACSSGTCVALVEVEDRYELSISNYGENAGKLPDKQDFGVVFKDKSGNKIASEAISVEFEAEVSAVFAAELAIEGDPTGGDASGSVNLLGAADKKGKQATLAKGSFYASFARDSDGDLALGGYGADDRATSGTEADAQLGDPVECGGEGCDGEWVPPVILYGLGGKITKLVVSSGGLGYDAF